VSSISVFPSQVSPGGNGVIVNGQKDRGENKACQSIFYGVTQDMKRGSYTPTETSKDKVWESCRARPYVLPHTLGEPASFPAGVKDVGSASVLVSWSGVGESRGIMSDYGS
jgi:hypothetical protein